MDRTDPGTQRLNDTLFALVLAAAAACAVLLAWAASDAGDGLTPHAEPVRVELDRVVVVAPPAQAVPASTVELPRVVVRAKRLTPAVASAGAVDPNS